MIFDRAAGLLRDAAPTAAASATTGVVGVLTAAPTWLVGLGQAVVVVIGVLAGIDKRERRREERLAKIERRVKSLACVADDPDEEEP